MATAPPSPGQSLATALDRSEPLTGLLQRLRASRARYDAIAGLLPTALRAGVRPGPLDEATWVLLVPNAAAAAKLRQMLPQLQQALAAAGWGGPPIKLKVRPPA
ncbi:MAG: DUF721 domain-containing protein [Burkholderiales bacterium]|nr:DUF721 domain-containing protein [Burkholderiales bacterium]MDE2275648.1 DUF721 domain-containing protein [Burkholderiales bacterium]